MVSTKIGSGCHALTLQKPPTAAAQSGTQAAGGGDECRQPGASVAGVALAHGLNANLVRRWMAEQGVEPPSRRALPEPDLGFVPIRLEPTNPPPSQDIRIERHRGSATVTIIWPLAAAGECGAWLRDWLR